MNALLRSAAGSSAEHNKMQERNGKRYYAGIPGAAWRHASSLQVYSAGFSAEYLHVKFCHFGGDSHLTYTIFICRVVFISYAPVLVRSLFVMLSLYASMHSVRLVVCLLFVCVGCVLCLLKGSLRRTPL